VGPIYKKRE